jgi:protein SCO1/2
MSLLATAQRVGVAAGVALSMSLFALAVSCGKTRVIDPTAVSGVALPAPLARPAFTLPDTHGSPYNFRDRTAGTLTLLFFGYTHCPDVCPVHLANIQAALRTLDYADRQQVRVVFVTTDPTRDSADVLRRWLDNFNPAFVGLRGTEAQVDSVQTMLGLAPAVRGPVQPDGSYSVGHAGQVIVFQPDDTARVVYPFGTRQTEWAHDLPLLLRSSVTGFRSPS